MGGFVIGESVTYWENFRAKGQVGGWAKIWRIGKVIAVNRVTVDIERVYSSSYPTSRVERVAIGRVEKIVGDGG